MASNRQKLNAVALTRSGLEVVLAEEARGLGLTVGTPEAGAVPFQGSLRQLYVAARWLRTATRVLLVTERFRARAFSSLERGLDEIDWGLLDDGTGLAPRIRVATSDSRLYHTGAVAERVLRSLGRDPALPLAEGADEDVRARVDVRIDSDMVSVRFDLSGVTLDRRGWRLATAKAPLPPTVAAAALLASGWTPRESLVDPLCGAGTIAVEAALMAASRQPTHERVHAVESWPSFEPGTWASAGASAAEPVAAAPIIAADRDDGAVAATNDNAQRAATGVDVRSGTISETLASLPAEPGCIVTNPPWGARIGDVGALRDLYAALGAGVRATRGWRLALITAHPKLARATGLELQRAWSCQVGGRDIALYLSAPD